MNPKCNNYIISVGSNQNYHFFSICWCDSEALRSLQLSLCPCVPVLTKRWRAACFCISASLQKPLCMWSLCVIIAAAHTRRRHFLCHSPTWSVVMYRCRWSKGLNPVAMQHFALAFPLMPSQLLASIFKLWVKTIVYICIYVVHNMQRIEITTEQHFKYSVGIGSDLWGGYVSGCHWVSDLEVNSYSSGFIRFNWHSLISEYKPMTNLDFEHCLHFCRKYTIFHSRSKTGLHFWVTCYRSQWLLVSHSPVLTWAADIKDSEGFIFIGLLRYFLMDHSCEWTYISIMSSQ